MQSLVVSKVNLLTKDLKNLTYFYKDILGLEVTSTGPNFVKFGFGGTEFLEIEEALNAKTPPPISSGLYHIAFRFSERSYLAGTLNRILSEEPSTYVGSSDHLVSEAFYFEDPDGNGVELYFDKSKTNWEYRNGKPLMGSVYLDTHKYINDYYNRKSSGGTIDIGHVHLKVADLKNSLNFYLNKLNFDLIFELDSAAFISKDNYHHHIGLNTWESFGAKERIKDEEGLISFELTYKDKKLFEQIKTNFQIPKEIKKFEVKDPNNTKITIIFA